VQGLKGGRGARKARPSHPARHGWCFRSGAGHLWIPVHSEAGHNITGMTSRAEVAALLVAVTWGRGTDDQKWFPVIQVAKTGVVDELSGVLGSEDDAYRLIVARAAEESGAVNLIDPNASWRKRESAAGAPARAVARRIVPRFEIPEDATAGFVGDVITVGQYGAAVDSLGTWVTEQVAKRTYS